jgi:hypothetical protein
MDAWMHGCMDLILTLPTYLRNERAGETTWYKPNPEMGTAVEAWDERFDSEKNQHVYVNKLTGETILEHPALMMYEECVGEDGATFWKNKINGTYFINVCMYTRLYDYEYVYTCMCIRMRSFGFVTTESLSMYNLC